MAELTGLMLDAKNVLEADKFVTGSGTNEPWGIVARAVQAAKTTPTAAQDVFALADVYTAYAAVPARHRSAPGFGWLMSDITANAARRFGETVTGQSAVLVDSLAAGTPTRLIGKPLYISTIMETAGATVGAGNDEIAVVGDLKQYVIVDRLGATVELIPWLFGAAGRPTGQRGCYLYFRSGGDLAIPDAVRAQGLRRSRCQRRRPPRRPRPAERSGVRVCISA